MEQVNLEALKSEELSSEETHELLTRLNAREFGGSENATVGAVSEATGSSVETVGKLLADIRKIDFEKRFGLAVQQQGRRIDSLEHRTEALEGADYGKVKTSPAFDSDTRDALERVAERERRRRAMRPFALAMLVATMLLMVMSLANKAPRPSSPELPFRSVELNGKEIAEFPNGVFRAKQPDGTFREATKEEIGMAESLFFQIEKKNPSRP